MTKAEENILGEMLLDPSIIPQVASMLQPQMFTDALCGKIFHTIITADVEPDIEYVVTKSSSDEYPSMSVRELVNQIVVESTTSINYQTDCKIIYDSWVARQTNRILNETKINAGNVYEAIANLTNQLNEIHEVKDGSKTIKQIAEEYRDRYFKKRDKPLLKTGFEFLDKYIGGLEGGDVIVIGARPAVGKSALAMQLASQIVDDGFKVQLFNLEMTEKQIYERLVSYESGIPQYHIRMAEHYRSYEEELIIKGANEKLDRLNNYLVSTGSKKVSDIRKEVLKEKPDIVIVDYLQLLKTDVSYRGNRYAEVGMISHALKGLAIEMNIPVVVLTQLNRVSDGVKEPSMAEIRESGDVEQDASIIILLWNKDNDDKTIKGCKIDKNRGGELGKLELVFNGSRMRFEDSEGFAAVDDDDIPFIAEDG